MPITLDTQSKSFESDFKHLLEMKREADIDVDEAAAAIIADIQKNGDEGLIRLTEKFDRFTVENLRISEAEIQAAIQTVPEAQKEALSVAAKRIEAFHRAQLPDDAWWEDADGVKIGWRFTPIASVGLYVPGGLASYPSSVLMNAIPAKVAGVERLVICVPTPDNQLSPLVLLAAHLSGVREIYRVGGAQAIAALAYGTETIPPVDKITGPGNAFVAAAKRRVFGKVGIDMIAGPSEILVIADEHNNPDWIAVDLLSQAEHDESAQSILITPNPEFAAEVAKAVEARLQTLERKATAGASWRDFGAIITTRSIDEAITLSDRIAPEHLELCVENAEEVAQKIRHAGAIFIGQYSPEAIGDYVSGANHVLPTARSARFSSGLSVLDFLKRSTLSQLTPKALQAIGPAAVELAKAEGLEAHGLSVSLRLESLNTRTTDA